MTRAGNAPPGFPRYVGLRATEPATGPDHRDSGVFGRNRPRDRRQVTGEVRWRRPQDFLELLPRPACGDCAGFEAFLECASCGEFFCSACFAKVIRHPGTWRHAPEGEESLAIGPRGYP